MKYQIPYPWGYFVAMTFGVVFALQAIFLKEFRESQYSSKEEDKFVPPQWLRILYFGIGTGIFLWSLVKFLLSR